MVTATYSERFEHITVPLLSRLALALDRPQITTPSLIEINSGFWDLRRFTEGTAAPSRNERVLTSLQRTLRSGATVGRTQRTRTSRTR